jgi:hypothetical protein
MQHVNRIVYNTIYHHIGGLEIRCPLQTVEALIYHHIGGLENPKKFVAMLLEIYHQATYVVVNSAATTTKSINIF